MKIALAHFRVGETDGVSLEMDKWRRAFENMGHEVVFLAGSQGQTEAYVIEELYYMHPLNNKFVYNAYERMMDYEDELSFKQDMLKFAESIEKKLVEFIRNEKIDLLIPNNILSLGWSLPAAIAFCSVAKKLNIPMLCHHHDFFWERERYSQPTCRFIHDWLDKYFPPRIENVHHVVINQIARDQLETRKGLQAEVVPNVFDFDGDPWKTDGYNHDLRRSIGIGEDDLVILQATRITERKAVELGIDVVAEIQKHLIQLKGKTLYNGKQITSNTKVVYLLAGMPESTPRYLELLKKKAAEQHVNMLFIHEQISHTRRLDNHIKIYSLWDAYSIADLITYPSILEGWGNQLLEGVFAQKPIVIYEYPVFGTDIADKGFFFISLGANYQLTSDGLVFVPDEKITHASREAVLILTDHELYQRMIEENFKVARKHYSYLSLEQYLLNIPLLQTFYANA
ncbi:glycosyl transferase family 1 [Bacillus sp. FJAT-27225]|uniref:glycosyltransferase family 4 protein n=1 Tax=Bacillus sp. FJAT-27225 TaxID=1743144 RepID=UPI00080C27F5|nr:glycosyltransferase family 4 protein [Bacillus sp. FJAT-27225]OCA87880.1 glycosyl transferase family 1 [Bacillus sp. FJAT-27225]